MGPAWMHHSHLDTSEHEVDVRNVENGHHGEASESSVTSVTDSSLEDFSVGFAWPVLPRDRSQISLPK